MDSKILLAASLHLLCTALIFWGIVRTLIVYVLTAWNFYIPLDFVAVIFIAKFTFKFVKNQFLNDRVDTQRAILITGCDTGFGHLLAKRLDSEGYYVFASCLFPSGSGATSLKETCSKRLKVLELDVAKDNSVKDAVEYVKENLESRELWAIVNNAGIHKGFSLELTGIDEFKDSMEVNAIGPVRVTKAFLPLLKKSKGRIVNMTSLAGRVCMPYVLPYFMSKYAAQGFSDCLRQELDEWGIKVISIEPEIFLTQLTDKQNVGEKLNTTLDAMEDSVRMDCDAKRLITFKKMTNFFLSLASPNVELVVDDLESAVTFKYPDSIYKPRRNFFARLLFGTYEVMPNDFQDLIMKTIMSGLHLIF